MKENQNFDEKKYFEKLNKEFKEERENKIISEDNYIKMQLTSLANIIYEYSREIPYETFKEMINNTLMDIERNQKMEKSKVKKIGTKK